MIEWILIHPVGVALTGATFLILVVLVPFGVLALAEAPGTAFRRAPGAL